MQKPVTVLLSEDQFRRFSAYCSAKGFKKSTLIARLIKEHLDSESGPASGSKKSKRKR